MIVPRAYISTSFLGSQPRCTSSQVPPLPRSVQLACRLLEVTRSYGVPRVHAELRMGDGITVGHNSVAMLMRRAGLQELPAGKRWRALPDTPTVGDLVDRNFAVVEPDALWVTDITEHPTREGKLYCSVVLDAYSRRVVGWSTDSTQTAALVTN